MYIYSILVCSKLHVMKGETAGVGSGSLSAGQQVGTSFIQRNLKFLPKNSISENLRTVKGLPKIGVNWANFDGTNYELLGVHDESYPRCCWIWNAYTLQLQSLLVLMEPIVCCRWKPNYSYIHTETGELIQTPSVLAMCTGTSRVYFWTPTVDGEGLPCPPGITTWADLPILTHAKNATSLSINNTSSSFGITHLRWSADGSKLVLIGRDTYCTCEVDYTHCKSGITLANTSELANGI